MARKPVPEPFKIKRIEVRFLYDGFEIRAFNDNYESRNFGATDSLDALTLLDILLEGELD